MTLEEGKRRGAIRIDTGWELIIPGFHQRDGSWQPPSRVFWPDQKSGPGASTHGPSEPGGEDHARPRKQLDTDT